MKTNKLKIIFFGTPEFVNPVLETIYANFSLVAVVTSRDQKIGRKQILMPSGVALKTEQLGVAVIKADKFDEQILEQIENLEPDLLVVASFGKILPDKLLEIPKYGALNIHPSLLPKYRGASPMQSAILNGDEVSGITIIKMDEEMDHGPIVFKEEFRLSDQDNFQILSKKMFMRSAEILPQVITDFVAGKIKPLGQDNAIASYCPMIKKEDGYFEIDNPPSAEKLDRMIRAYYPWPTVWTKWKGKIVKLLPSLRAAAKQSIKMAPRVEHEDENKVLLQMEGKKAIPLKDFLNGYPDFPIKNL